jgi:nitric oxide reductase large subunit
MPAGFFWSSDAIGLKRAFPSRAPHTNKRERTPQMVKMYSDLLVFILMALAVGFMLWALWNFHKAERERQ